MKLFRIAVLVTLALTSCGPSPEEKKLIDGALANGAAAREGFERSDRFVRAWLQHADPTTGLVPRNLNKSKDLWNARDTAADNWSYMVLTAYFTDEALFNGRMKEMLATEERVTSRIDRMPDNYVFSTKTWENPTLVLDNIIFEAAEYAKDGLIPITDLIGPSEWSVRMIGLVDDIWKHAPIETPSGLIPTLNLEVGGDLLQVCSRLFWYTGDRKYLDWAIRLGDYYLLGDKHPTRQTEPFGLSDHGCEVINGLSELYVACAEAAPEKREQYRPHIHEMYDRLLEIARDEHGLFFSLVNMQTGENNHRLTDNWGYNFDGVYTVYMLDGTEAYRESVRKALGSLLEHYIGYPWQGGGMDGYADSIEGAITLYNRERIPSAAQWIDSEIRKLWKKQRSSGIIEGWHCDGNFARTSLMYSLWKTQGTFVRPWRADVTYGALPDGDGILIAMKSEKPWKGLLVFDRPRHREIFHLPFDYPRINQFPEWFTAESNATYRVSHGGKTETISGAALRAGLDVALEPGKTQVIRVSK